MKEKFVVDQATGLPYILTTTEHSQGGVEGATFVEVTEEEFAAAVAKREHPLHKDRPKKGKGKGK